MNDILLALEKDGYAVVHGVLSPEDTASTEQALTSLPLVGAGTRNLLEFPWCRDLARCIAGNVAVKDALPPAPVAVQCTYFDKSSERNWLVPLHQDLSIPARERAEHPELCGWSRKEGQHFVQPPAEFLERLLAVRVHIDDCGPDNGPLRVVPGSHRHGRIADVTARQLRDTAGEVSCAIDSGGALLMRPLLLHASSKASSPGRRRVLHFLFGPASVGYGLLWQHAVAQSHSPDHERLASSTATVR